jgi:hypothetical protein
MKKVILILTLVLTILAVSCTKTEKPVACTMDAKACPDGSFVGRIAPNCEFEACPPVTETPSSGKLAAIQCTDEQREVKGCTKEYMPVCGWFADFVKCIKYPCASTYGNKCMACQNPNVGYYTQGECPNEEDLKRI